MDENDGGAMGLWTVGSRLGAKEQTLGQRSRLGNRVADSGRWDGD